MTVTAGMVDRVRRMVAEPFATSAYTNEDIETYVAAFPLADDDGRQPDEYSWVANYDLHAAAAEIWSEKAAAVAADYNFTADGATVNRESVYKQYMQQHRFHAARRQPANTTVMVSPKALPEWIGNLPEE